MDQFDNTFFAWTQSISKLLAVYRDHSAVTSDHGDVLGKAREAFVSEVLRRFLPQALHVGAGQIVDGDGKLSKQVDVIIYRDDMPLLSSLAETNLYFVEGVVGVIEIKSRLDAQKLREALNNCLSVKALNINFPSKGGPANDFMTLRYTAPASYIFGYSGYKGNLVELKRTLVDWVRQNGIDTLSLLPEVIVTEGITVVKNDYRFFDADSFRRQLGYLPIFLATTETTPLTWLLHHLLGQIGGDLSQTLPNRSVTQLLGRNHRAREDFERRAQCWGKWDRDLDTGRILEFD